MIELYRANHSAEADRAEAALQDLVVAHVVHVVDDPGDGPGGDLPMMRDGDRLVPAAEIPEYLDEVRRLIAEWRRFQSDACYIGGDGQPC